MKIILFFLSFFMFFQTNADIFIPWTNCNKNFDEECFNKCQEESVVNYPPACESKCCYSEPKIVHDNLVLISIIWVIFLFTLVFFQYKRKQKLYSKLKSKDE